MSMPNKRRKTEMVRTRSTSPARNKDNSVSKATLPVDPIAHVLDQRDIWVAKILPFLGPGHYIFVAGVNRQFKHYYLEYFSKLKCNTPKVTAA